MVAQIIFFFAIGLFLVLLLRRANTFDRFGVIWSAIVNGIGAASNVIRQNAKQAMQNRPSVNMPDFRREKETKEPSNVAAESKFWGEDLVEEKPDIMSHYDEGEVLFKAGNYEEAEKFFLKAATRNPKDAKVYARLGLIYLHKDNFSDAVEALKVASKLDKYNPSRYYNLALAYQGKNDNQRAIATIREAISLDPVSQKYRSLLEQLLNKK